MFHLRNLLLCCVLVITATFTQTVKADGTKVAEKVESSLSERGDEGRAVGDSTFEKRQGFTIEDGEDQLAMESQVAPDQMAVETSDVRDQVAVESGHNGQIPVPYPIRTVPGTIILPMPQQNQNQPGQNNFAIPHPQMRAPPPHHQFQQGKQGQIVFHPQQQQQSGSGPQPQFLQQQNTFQQQQPPHPQFHPQQPRHVTPQPIIVSTPSGDAVIQKATEISISSGTRQQSSAEHFRQHHPSGLVPPLPHPQAQQQQQQQARYVQQQNQQLQPQHRAPGMSSAEITKNIIRELFDRKPPGMKDGRPNGGFFGPGQSQPKVLNNPVPQRIAGGGLFTSGKEAALSTNDLHAEGGDLGLPVQYGVGPPSNGGGGGDPSWPAGPDGDTPKIVSLEVKCEKNVMRVFVAFDKPFFGVIFSKGHYHNVACIHLPAGLGHTSANFDISIDSCGTGGNTENGLYGYGVQSGSGSYFENTIVIQYDSQVQEVWDQARKLRCTWHDQYEKSVTFRPFPVDMLDVVRADFAGDNVGCWMQIQVGKGPWASEVSGLVKIGQTMTMVLAIKDDDNKFDMMVRNCLAHDGQRAPIQLVDQWGCITRPKLMSPFTKIKNFGASATVLSYAHFQAFKFPDSMEVHFQCTIQICRHQCPEQCSQSGAGGPVGKSGLPAPGDRDDDDDAARRRRRRAANETEEPEIFEYQTTFKADFKEDVGLNRVITVVSPDDLDFGGDSAQDSERSSSNEEGGSSSSGGVPLVESGIGASGELVCMSTFGFAAMITLLIGLLLVACIISAVIVIKKRPSRGRKGF
ncbi:uncharacterized protein LOC110858766 [Folsomia candida]|uniref:uncharacterized protein LOC110858766 n=1 Tax=Folsomia candida TaxID=158441 RepID=UPI000B8F6728|nr:uncharacterized protein LOC110858766 [Folsomia candida]